MSAKTGGPAFPVNTENACQSGACFPNEGMTLRDYFAAKAMQGMFNHESMAWNDNAEKCAKYAYKMADAMLKAREA